MNRLFIFLFVTFFCASSLASNVKSPADVIKNFKKDEQYQWLGKVVKSRAYLNENNETVMEWLCEYYEKDSDIEIRTAFGPKFDKDVKIKARKVDGGYFVITVRMKPNTMSLQEAQKTVREQLEAGQFGIQDARVQFIGEYDGQEAVYTSGSGLVTGNLKVKVVK